MNLDPYELGDLIARHIQQKLSTDESQRLLDWLNESVDNQYLFERLVKAEQVKESLDFFDAVDADAAWKKAYRKNMMSKIKGITPYLGYAAVVTSIIFSFFIFLPQEKQPFKEQTKVVKAEDLPPGKEKALLRLSNGEIVHLADNYAKISVHQGLHAVCKDGELNYLGSTFTGINAIYNTLSVPKSGTFRVVLADGTKVWLNSLSEIKYPVRFNDRQRSVKVTGEAYFEVAPDPFRPFLVEVDNEKIEVLGTHFNVKSYNAQTRTTLLEGSVKISNSSEHKVLVPGEEAHVIGNKILVKKGDLKKVIAWRNNEFYFKNEPIGEVLVELSRWYGFEVNAIRFEDHKRFSGSINRDLNLSEVLKILHSLSGYHFQFDGSSVIINN